MNKSKLSINRIHFLSGLIITIFIGLHLFNHFISVFGVEAHVELMDKLRIVYRNVISEMLLLVSVVVQIISGLKLFFSKRKVVNGFYEKMQIWTGLYLAFFLIVHVGAVLTGRYVLKLDTNFYFGVAGLNTFPINLFFVPYYGFGIIAFFGHISAIHYKKMKKEIFRFTVHQQSKFILIIGIVTTGLILYGLTNGLKGVEIPEEYNILIGK